MLEDITREFTQASQVLELATTLVNFGTFFAARWTLKACSQAVGSPTIAVPMPSWIRANGSAISVPDGGTTSRCRFRQASTKSGSLGLARYTVWSSSRVFIWG